MRYSELIAAFGAGTLDAEAVRRAAIEAAATRFRETTQVPVFFGVPDK
jgi:hypothetical protein